MNVSPKSGSVAGSTRLFAFFLTSCDYYYDIETYAVCRIVSVLTNLSVSRPSSILHSSITGLLSPIQEPSDLDELDEIGEMNNLSMRIHFLLYCCTVTDL